MKKWAWLLIIGITFSFILSLMPPSYASSQKSVKIANVHRDFYISRNGIITIIDNYEVRNDGLDSVTSIYIGLNEDYLQKLTYIKCYLSDSDEELDLQAIPNQGNGFDQWIVLFKTPLNPKDHKNFSIEMEFVDLISISTEKRVAIQFNKYPSSPYLIEQFDETIFGPSDCTIHDPFTDTDKAPPVNSPTETNIKAWSTETINFYITFTTGTPMYGFISVKQEIDLNNIGYIQVAEEHEVRNIGPGSMDALSSIKFAIPSDAKNIMIYDLYGQLSFNEKSGGSFNNISISLTPNRYAIRIGEKFTYNVEYVLPIENYMSFSGDIVSVNIDLLLGRFNSQVYHFISHLILPKGSMIQSFTGDNIIINCIDGKPTITFDDYGITDSSNAQVNIQYNSAGSYWFILGHPLIIALIIGVIASLYVVFKRAIPTTGIKIERKTVVPSSIVREFCFLYEQKIALMSEIDKLDKQYQRRKLRSREYRKLLKNTENNISDIDKSLDEIKPEFRSVGGRYKEIVDKLEILEGEKTTIKDSLVRLKARYKRKQIKPIAYRKLNRDFKKRINKIKSNMERLVQELRDYII
ncbi:MAG: hypothetical protein GF329_09120 [Candidatus Lokiarchaeota archaeon]|nr:hypothetical protein [Candidatus Lokiarchaeota archaeon]